MSDTEIGYIKGNSNPGACDEAFEQIRGWLESARVYVNSGIIKGWIKSADTPGADDRDKLWLKTVTKGAHWYYWDTDCGAWCPVGSRRGERVTRYRIEDTVADDIETHMGCGWELADGTNLLSVDLLNTEPKKIYSLDL